MSVCVCECVCCVCVLGNGGCAPVICKFAYKETEVTSLKMLTSGSSACLAMLHCLA